MFGYHNVVEDLVVEKLMEAEGESIPVIIAAKDCDCDDLESYVKKLGGTIKHRLDIINAVAVQLPSLGVRSAARERVIEKIFFDDMAYKLMDIASVTVGSDYANARGLTGKDIGVAVIDTGVHPHDDLVRPTNRIVAFQDFVNKRSQPYDDDGHGTHVAGIIAGNGFQSRGKYMGIAPDANIIGIKVLNQDGGGSVSDVIAGIQWAIQNRQKYNIKVLTLSLGTKAKASYQADPLCQATAKAVEAGITVFSAAGNNGPASSTINSPAISPQVIAVGACNDRSSDHPGVISVADFSSRGPTLDGLSKPDILAPGVGIYSLNNEGGYTSHSGTSMATPIAAGCAALLYEYNKNFSPEQIRREITSHATPLGVSPEAQGAGLLDVRKIIDGIRPPTTPKTPEQAGSGFPLSGGLGEWFWVILIVILVMIL